MLVFFLVFAAGDVVSSTCLILSLYVSLINFVWFCDLNAHTLMTLNPGLKFRLSFWAPDWYTDSFPFHVFTYTTHKWLKHNIQNELWYSNLFLFVWPNSEYIIAIYTVT